MRLSSVSTPRRKPGHSCPRYRVNAGACRGAGGGHAVLCLVCLGVKRHAKVRSCFIIHHSATHRKPQRLDCVLWKSVQRLGNLFLPRPLPSLVAPAKAFFLCLPRAPDSQPQPNSLSHMAKHPSHSFLLPPSLPPSLPTHTVHNPTAHERKLWGTKTASTLARLPSEKRPPSTPTSKRPGSRLRRASPVAGASVGWPW